MITERELAQHSTAADCWIAFHGKVYDLTAFLERHPGGSEILLKFAGKDASKVFGGKHPASFLTMLPEEACLGELEGGAAPADAGGVQKPAIPPLETLLNTRDFQAVAELSMEHEGWIYYSTAAEDERTFAENEAAFGRWWFRPRVLVDVSHVDAATTILGVKSSFPLFLSASAMSGLAHPEAELALAKATGSIGVPQMVPTISTRTHEEIASHRPEGHTQFLQLYVNRDHRITEALVHKGEDLDYKALFLTVDTPLIGRRERDLRNKYAQGQSVIRSLGTISDPSLTWAFVDWLKSITKLPIVLKGVQRGDDAQRAQASGVAGILVSNHGGRQLDGARSSLDALEEIMETLGPRPSMEVYLDGGIRRGTDVVKALALGARAVGLARPVVYGLAGYGAKGAETVLRLLKEETELCMALCGAPNVGSITRDLIVRRPQER